MSKWLIGAVFLWVTLASDARDGVGISSWAGWRPGDVSRVECPELRSVPILRGWDALEPKPGQYEFDKQIGDPLRKAAEDDLCVFLLVWVRPGTPSWLFDELRVPKVYTDRGENPVGKKMSKEDNLHPYYFHPAYKAHFFKLIDAMGEYVSTLPPGLRNRILFVQSAEGSTGDGQPYKGTPLDKKYEISEGDWNLFRRETWIRYQTAFKEIPILVNSDANTKEEYDWMFANMDVIALKHGMFSHGYQVSENVERLNRFAAVRARAAQTGKSVLTRGEQDGEMFVYGWSTKNIPQALYWSGIFATHCYLDVWNVPVEALKDPENRPALSFFNRYAGLHDPARSPRAFCVLMDGLDAADFDRFPAAVFGGSDGNKKDVGRYLKIAAAFSKYGARMEDPEKATGGGMVNRKAMGYNDVGWGIPSANYSRFLTQVEPGSGDIGRWNLDQSIYGRFARSFDHESGKKVMRFALDEAFRAETVEVRVLYRDQGTGRWSIGISGRSEKKEVSNADSGEWKTVTFPVARKALVGAELLLSYEGGDDTTFHLVEVESR